jgi:hypothetical protein
MAVTNDKRDARRSPLRAAPLRVPGQSIDSELDDLITDEYMAPFLMALFGVLLAGFEWWRYFTDAKPSPWLLTALAAGVSVWAALRMRRALVRVRDLRLGRSGERAVAQYLEWFRTKDFFVFHDVPTGDSNIDHVLIGTRGIFAVETKTLSKPMRGDARISVEKDGIRANGFLMTRNPIVQAKAQARWLYNFFGEVGFKNFVQPVVVFPGWFVEPCDFRSIGVWVLEPKGLDGFIDRQAVAISTEEVKAMSSALSSYIRAQSNV